MNTKQLINPIARWNHRLPSLAAATAVTGLLLAGIVSLSTPGVDASPAPLAAAAQSNVTG